MHKSTRDQALMCDKKAWYKIGALEEDPGIMIYKKLYFQLIKYSYTCGQGLGVRVCLQVSVTLLYH